MRSPWSRCSSASSISSRSSACSSAPWPARAGADRAPRPPAPAADDTPARTLPVGRMHASPQTGEVPVAATPDDRGMDASYGQAVRWEPAVPRLRLVPTLVAWAIAAASVWIAAAILPGMALDRTGAAVFVAALVAVINAVIPPVLAALRLPFTLASGFILVLLADAGALLLADAGLPDDVHVASFGTALG